MKAVPRIPVSSTPLTLIRSRDRPGTPDSCPALGSELDLSHTPFGELVHDIPDERVVHIDLDFLNWLVRCTAIRSSDEQHPVRLIDNSKPRGASNPHHA